MKKLAMLLTALVMTISASAQFEQGKVYCGSSLSGLNLSYSGLKDLQLNLDAKAGYCVEDNWMVLAQGGIDSNKDMTALSLGVGGRYYIIQNGIYLGANCSYKHAKGYNDVVPGIEIGYAYFLNRHVTIEPSIYYDQSIKKHSDYSTIGVRLGLGIYF